MRGSEEWLCVHMAECHFPELEVWCKGRLRVCGSTACVVACVAAEETGAG